MTIKALGVEFSKEIAKLFSDSFSDGWTEQMLTSAFVVGNFFSLGAFDGDNLIGAVTFSVAVDTADIEDVVTATDYRRKGVARQLLLTAENELKEKGVNKIFLEVRSSNAPANNLYISLGYEKISVRKKYYPDGEDAVVMAKEI